MKQHDFDKLTLQTLSPIVNRPMGYARLGRGDGAGVIISDATNRMAYIFDTNVGSEAKLSQDFFISAIDNKANEGRRIQLAYLAADPAHLYIVGMDPGEGMASLGGVSLNEQRTTSTQYPDVGKLLNFRLKANDPPNLNYFIGPSGYYDLDGVWHWWGGGERDTDFDTEIAALSGEHQLAVAYFDVSTGLTDVVLSDPVTGGASNKNYFDGESIEALSTAAAFNDGQILVGAFHLYDGQTEIKETDIYRDFDPRVGFPTPGSTGSGSTDDSGLYLAMGF